MSPKTAVKTTAPRKARTKGITVAVIGDALAAPKKVQQGKERGFGSGYQDAPKGIKVSTDALHTLLVLFSLYSELGSWRFDGKTGAIEGGKAAQTIEEFQLAGMSLLEASLAVKRIYTEMGKLRNRYVDELKEVGIVASSYESTAKALKALVK
jgi:hypothetical protein